MVLLKNAELPDGGRVLPLQGRPRLYLEHVARDVAARYGEIVARPDEADVAIVRASSPFEPRGGLFERIFHAGGDLDFAAEEKARILAIMAAVPAVFCITLERPTVMPEILEHSAAVLADFGASDDAVLDVVFGRFSPTAHLPFELPSSMEAVRQQKPDVPHDSEHPLFPLGFGLGY
jgi:beta-glucosidase